MKTVMNLIFQISPKLQRIKKYAEFQFI